MNNFFEDLNDIDNYKVTDYFFFDKNNFIIYPAENLSLDTKLSDVCRYWWEHQCMISDYDLNPEYENMTINDILDGNVFDEIKEYFNSKYFIDMIDSLICIGRQEF